ncbi:hypothetical protein JIG36_46355 [Actinoplanes sp. LDG1-06]|uniref:Uncharacterized protein n=1 Tax=Paractinoplanes ovalisporus TaxID=2810368 RepID=A0ABS2ASU3_9ACTN|nr:hypothetical protein [Actinoplanes ovalisporus]MBM2622947.1 hypothetical protein [Actinoplanes ovalisporus]
MEREAAAAAAETLAAVTGGAVRWPTIPGHDEDRTRLTVELLAAGELIDTSQARPTPAYDRFTAADPADQLLDIIDIWLTMPACPLAPGPARLLQWNAEEEFLLGGLRSLMLRTLVDAVPADRSVDPEGLAERLLWQAPDVAEEAADGLPGYVAGIWREAHRLGLLAHGSPTELCRRRLAGGAAAAREPAQAMLPRPPGSVPPPPGPGRVLVRPVGCCLCSDDDTLLTEILDNRSLEPLGLVRLAPTVLASAEAPAATLTALRAAGYAPASLHVVGGGSAPDGEMTRLGRSADQ